MQGENAPRASQNITQKNFQFEEFEINLLLISRSAKA